MLVTLGIQKVKRKPLMAQIAQGTFHLQTSEIQDLTCLFLAKDYFVCSRLFSHYVHNLLSIYGMASHRYVCY